MSKKIMGVSALFHDASIAMIEDDQILFAGHSERYGAKVKLDQDLNPELVKNALQYGSPDELVWYENHWKKRRRQVYAGEYKQAFSLDSFPKKYLKKHGLSFKNTPLSTFDHHYSHACAGYYTSPFKDAVIVVIDAIGEWDIDKLYMKALGMRWLVFDELSTLSPYLLGLLDAYLRRACCRHPYAKCRGRRRAFGGINLVLAGDLWQLPPVRSHSIFSNPYLPDYSGEEQMIFKMFWRPTEANSIQKTFLLTQSMRTQDKWLRSVLNADRYGNESWEMYCFQHGLPTRNPGTWLPETNAPWCGNTRCATLATDVWPLQMRRGATARRLERRENWLRRLEEECEECKTERKRRCCILAATGDQATKHLEEPFTCAPFIHPFRHPSYHATQLRAVSFAKLKNKRLHWLVAYDQLKNPTSTGVTEEKEFRKERWLEFHDRFTSGIPGVFPAVLDLPVRFTESVGREAREMGVFKHTRGILHGWELEQEEKERLANTTLSEVVLKRRPLSLYIEVPTGTDKMPTISGKKMYILKVQRKQWSLDKAGNVKVTRFGFPIVPDFGGTAHAYCGSTIDASLGDLLPWHKKPQLDDMLKAYIIKSRIRLAENLLLVQPYSPHLFRHGLLPGPQLLLDVLSGKISEKQAKSEWKRIQKSKEEKHSSSEAWLLAQTIPCRLGTEKNAVGQEVWKPLSSFSTDIRPDDLWLNVVSRGQDAICFTCRSELGDESTLQHMCCEACGTVKHKDKFPEAERERWQSLDRHAILCMACAGTAKGRSDVKMVQCNGELCQGLLLPEYHFEERHLTDCRAKNLAVDIQCARCFVRSDHCERKDQASAKQFERVACKVTMPIARFASVAIKEWLRGSYKTERWRCYECQYPQCHKCAARPVHAVPHNAMIRGNYYCEECRYPACKGPAP